MKIQAKKSQKQNDTAQETQANSRPYPKISVSAFLSPFFPDSNETIHLRAFKPRKAPTEASNFPKTYQTTRGQLPFDAELQQELQADNITRGLYFVVNAGGNSDEEITRYTAFFVENDTLPIEQQHSALDAAPLQPSIRNETKKSVHAFWLVVGGCTKEEWRDVQARLIAYFQGDKQNCNPSRCMRLPHFNHVTFNDVDDYSYKPVDIVFFDPARRFTVAEMQAAFPEPEKEINQQPLSEGTNPSASDSQFATWEELNAELGRRIVAAGNRNSKGKYEMRCPAHNGESDTSLFFNPNNGAIKCMAGCRLANVLRAFGLPEQPSQNNGDGGVSNTGNRPANQATALVGLAEDAELFITQDDEAYASVPAGNHQESWSLRSKGFRAWLARRYYATHGRAPSAQALKDGLGVLEGKALYDGERKTIYTRIAECDGEIYLDLTDEEWRAVRITADGWEVIQNPPVKFRRMRGMKSLPMPIRGSSVDELDKFINVHGDDRILVKTWLVGALRPRGPYPVLVFHGEQGSAKSTTARVLADLIDPNEAALRSEPQNDRDLMIAATNRMLVAFDNLSRLSPSLSDALCRLATGGGYATRQLHTDGDEKIFNVQRPVLLTGIEELATRGDLLDRSIIVYLPSIGDKKRLPEAEFWREFESARPRIFGALLNAVSIALHDVDSVMLEQLPRMADFAKWGTAAERGLGLKAGELMRAYSDNRNDASSLALEVSPVASAIRTLMRNQQEWVGTASALLDTVNRTTDMFTYKQLSWPKSPQKLSNDLRRLAPNLRENGIDVNIGQLREPGTGQRLIRIKRMGGLASQASQASQTAEHGLPM